MAKWIAVLVSCLALGLVVAGCGGDDEDDGGGNGAATTTEQTTAEETAAGGGGEATVVVMRDIQFDPSDVTVDKGGTVEWVNEESVGHDVTKTSGPGPEFSSGSPGGMNEGDTYEHTFDAAGTYDYVCTVHDGMEGKVVVK